jgi:hypothetical protein
MTLYLAFPTPVRVSGTDVVRDLRLARQHLALSPRGSDGAPAFYWVSSGCRVTFNFPAPSPLPPGGAMTGLAFGFGRTKPHNECEVLACDDLGQRIEPSSIQAKIHF